MGRRKKNTGSSQESTSQDQQPQQQQQQQVAPQTQQPQQQVPPHTQQPQQQATPQQQQQAAGEGDRGRGGGGDKGGGSYREGGGDRGRGGGDRGRGVGERGRGVGDRGRGGGGRGGGDDFPSLGSVHSELPEQISRPGSVTSQVSGFSEGSGRGDGRGQAGERGGRGRGGGGGRGDGGYGRGGGRDDGGGRGGGRGGQGDRGGRGGDRGGGRGGGRGGQQGQESYHPPREQYQQQPQQQYQQQSPQQQQTAPQQSQPQQQQRQQTTPQQSPQQGQVKAVVPANISPSREIPANFRLGGTQGRRIELFVNHFELLVSDKVKTAYHYDVEIDPDKPKKLYPMILGQVQRAYYPKNNPAFDGAKNLYSAVELPICNPFKGKVKIMEDEREKEYEVKIQFAATIDLTMLSKFFKQRNTGQNHMLPPMTVLQCLDVVLRSAAAATMIKVGRSFFTVPSTTVRLGNGMEMYRGFYQSAILGWKPFINVDVSHKAFPTALNLIDLFYELDDRADLKQGLTQYATKDLAKHLYNLKVEYVIPGHPSSKRIYRVNGIGPNSSHKFQPDKGPLITIYDYFKNEKRTLLKYPNVPCLWVGSKVREPRVYIPSEFCRLLPGQVTNRKMNELQTRNMIKQAATNTTVRKENIMNSMRVANHNASPSVNEFGLSVNPNMTTVSARVLTPPALLYSDGQARVAKGVWRGYKFITGSDLGKWVILCLDDRTGIPKLTELTQMFISQGKTAGMKVEMPSPPQYMGRLQRGREQDAMNKMFTEFKEKQFTIIVVVLNGFVKSSYNWVKKAAEIHAGCLTQCIKSQTLMRLNTTTVDNILLKVNAKLNGLNHTFATRPPFLSRPVMIMGADVTHPSPDQRDIPSFAAVTASHDPKAFKYNLCWRLQDPKQEIIVDLQNIMHEQLMFFFRSTKLKPERIIFFRDGVSDGQFDTVRRMEIQAIRNACYQLDPTGGYKPAITFLVVQKRHHTRLFPKNSRDSEDRNMNVPAGTCVDTDITHPTAQDFFLVSHASIQGVAKPTKYRTLWDDSDMSDDELEQLTFYLCHLFTRCNRSVSYPAPTYYAHLAAARAKVYCEEENLNMSKLSLEQNKFQIKECIVKGLPMFFV